MTSLPQKLKQDADAWGEFLHLCQDLGAEYPEREAAELQVIATCAALERLTTERQAEAERWTGRVCRLYFPDTDGLPAVTTVRVVSINTDGDAWMVSQPGRRRCELSGRRPLGRGDVWLLDEATGDCVEFSTLTAFDG